MKREGLMPMRHISTRGKSAPQYFSNILLRGLAPDGGLYTPEVYPDIRGKLVDWQSLSYRRLAVEVLALFADLPTSMLREACTVYGKQIFDAPDVVGLKRVEEGLHLLDLTCGPTLAFKDMALQAYGMLAENVLARQGTTMNILGATTGDTGAAAEYAVKARKHMAIFMLSPQKGMSGYQRSQMYALQEKYVINLAVRASFDTCQDLVKTVNNDADFRNAYRIGAVNSINLARIVLQIVYYIYAYLRIARRIGDFVSFAVPTGNFGNICAGHMARMMGLPIGRLILASNENDVLVDFFSRGVYRPRGDREVVMTSSPSMNIQKASNLERFVFDLFDRPRESFRWGKTQALFSQLETTGAFEVSAADVRRMTEEFGFVSGRSVHADRLKAMQGIFAQAGIVIDPHTADGVTVATRVRKAGETVVCLMTASPLKFLPTVREALDMTLKIPRRHSGVLNVKPRVITIDPDVDALKCIIEAHAIAA